ncbi:class C sortase [Plantibacter flavus]|uniref:class C sortase n=2 Tax=Plantibacter TaxID=190323 RepID=UPI00099B83D9|nr:class C sortase [Plantibacter flavus]
MARHLTRHAPAARHARQPILLRRGFRWPDTLIALCTLLGVGLLLYPISAAWVSQFNQSNVVHDQTTANAETAASEMKASLDEAHRYNDLLESGALLKGGENVAIGTGETGASVEYDQLLRAEPTGTLARIRIPSIGLDLPVYHGTSDETLLKGVGHLQGTSLPVGGKGTKAVLTGHRGLASAEMFTRLSEVRKGDSINIEVLNQVLTYRIFEIQVVSPDNTEEIRPVDGADLITLVTCTPLGINTHRILVTAQRVLPTPQQDINDMASRPDVPGFPWWVVVATAAIGVVSGWYFNGWKRRWRAVRNS